MFMFIVVVTGSLLSSMETNGKNILGGLEDARVEAFGWVHLGYSLWGEGLALHTNN